MANAYVILYSGGNITVDPGNANVSTGITIMGQNYSNYGQPMNQNWMSLLENFASNVTAPNLAVKGMLWYDNANSQLKLNIANGTASWRVVSLNDSNGNFVTGTLAANVANANFFIGDGSNITNINAGNISSGTLSNARLAGTYSINTTGTANFANFAGNVTVSSQPNITSLGTLTGLAVSGNLTATNGNVTNNLSVGGNLSVTGTILGNITGNISGNFVVPGSNTQVLYNDGGIAGASSNLTFNGTTLVVNGNVNATRFIGNGATLSSITGANVTGAVSFASVANSVAGANVTGTVANATYAANAGNATLATQAIIANTVITATQPNITSLGTLTSLDVSGGVTAANITANTGTFSGNANGLFGIVGANVTGTVASANLASNAGFATNAGNATQANNSNTAATVTTAAQPNITSLGTLTGLTVTGNATVNGNGNVTGNMTVGGTLFANIQGNISGNIVAAGSNTQVLFNQQGNVGASSNLTFNGSTLAVTGNVNASAFNGNGVGLTGVPGSSVTGQVNFAATANSVAGANVSGTVANASFATLAATANTVAGANVVGTVANANYAAFAGTAFNVTAANVVGTVANANYAAFAGTAFNVSGGNVTGQVATANFANFSNHVLDASQPNITSVGTLTSLTVSGNTSTNNLSVTNTANIGGNLNVSGTINGNVSGNISGNLTVPGGNTQVIFNANGLASASSNLTFTGTTLTVSGNANATTFNGSGSGLTSIPGANVTGQVPFAAVANSVAAGNITGTVANANYSALAGVANTVSQAAQSNITSLGTLTTLNVSAQANATVFSSNVATGTAPLVVQSTTKVANLNADLLDDYTTSVATVANTVVVRDANGSIFGNQLIVNSIAATSLINGNSNVSIPSGNGNVNISSAGNANVVVVTGTGINVAGTLNVTGNANVGNIGATNGVFTNVIGDAANLTNLNASNISTGTLAQARLANSSLTVNGTSISLGGSATITANTPQSLSNGTYITGGSFNGATAVTWAVDATSTNTANKVVARDTNGNFAGNVITATTFIGNIQGNLTNGIVANGSSNVNIPVANGNVNISSSGNANILVVTGTGVNVAGTLNATGNITGDSIIGNGQALTGLNASNITSGTLAQARLANSSLTVNGTSITLGSSGTITANTTQTLTRGTYLTGANFNGGTATTWAVDATDAATASKVVARDANGSFSANVITANTFSGIVIGDGANLANLNASNLSSGTVPSARLSGTYTITVSGSATTAGTVTTAAQPNITSVGTLTSLSVTGNVAAGNLTSTGVLSVTGTGTSTIGGNLDMTSNNITNLASPVNASDAATKQYVDDVAQGLNVHDSVAAATTGTLATATGGTITYNNGSSGVGATLTTTGSYTTIDGVNIATSGTRILVKNEANAVHNGIYTYTSSTVITRATDYDSVPEVEAGDFMFVTGGTLYDNTGWVQTSTVTAIGTAGNTIDFAQFSGAGTYNAGTGLTLTGTTFSVNASQTQITSVGTLTGLSVNGNITAANITANTGVFTGNGSALSALNASNITSGTLAQARLANSSLTVNGTAISLGGSGTITANTTQSLSNGSYLTGGSFNGGSALTFAVDATDAATASKVVARDANGSFSANIITANNFSGPITGSGANLSNINASNITSGTLAQARLANSSLTVNGTAISLGGTGTITANTTQSHSNGAYITGGSFNGGAAITWAVDATDAATASKVVARDANGSFAGNVITANSFIGNGASMTNINASNISSGTLAQARLANSSLTVNGTSISLGGSGTVTANTGSVLTFSNGGSGDASGTTFNGGTARTISYNSVGAPSTTGTNASGTWAISITGTAPTVTTAAQPNITSVGTLTSLNVSGNITAPNLTANTGYLIGSVQTGISAAGSTQGTATALTRQYNIVSTVTAGQGVILPTAVAGMRLTVINTAAANLLIYPASTAAINSLGANTAFTLGGNTNAIDLVAATTTQWYTINAVYA